MGHSRDVVAAIGEELVDDLADRLRLLTARNKQGSGSGSGLTLLP